MTKTKFIIMCFILSLMELFRGYNISAVSM